MFQERHVRRKASSLAPAAVRFQNEAVNFGFEPLLKLSREERMEIIHRLWESLEADFEEMPLSKAQLAEVVRRKDRYEANPESGYSLEEVIEYALRDG